jgi:LmbE family N-acetylglucosaminyl deacetylase
MSEGYIPKKVLAFFAHPDDESFGPGGTIALWASEGAEIHIICATKGDYDGIGHIREEELKEAAIVLGVKHVEFLSYHDGKISNEQLLSLEKDFINRIVTFAPDTLLTFNLNGVSGHLDHIAVASAATQAFRKTTSPQRLYYYTLCKTQTAHMNNYFIYFPEGMSVGDMDDAIDVSRIWDKRLEAVHKHTSQQQDIDNFLTSFTNKQCEYFMVRTRA